MTDKNIMDLLEKQLIKDYGEEVVISGDRLKMGESISTGSINLDLILGNGIKEGTLCELSGRQGAGKTTLALYMATEAQKKGRTVIFFDAEFALKPSLLSSIEGLNIKDLKILRLNYAEDILDTMEKYVKSGEKVLIILDSVASLTSKKEAESSHEQESMMGIAKLMSKALRKMTGPVAKSDSNIVWLNQIRMKPTLYGNPEVTPGGLALDFHATYKIDVRTGGKKDFIVDDKGSIVGHNMNVKITKNKLFTPYKSATIPLIYGKGIDLVGELIGTAMELAIITRRGPRYYIDEVGHLGMDELRGAFENKELFDKTKRQILNMFHFEG